jgi:DNA-binding NarL/FixJ family response regulator
MPARTRVLLVDDHAFFRSGLREILAEFDELEIVGDAASGDIALPLVERRNPDVVVMDLHMPGLSGAEAARRIRDRSPRTAVLMLTVSAAEDDVIDALEAGAAGYLLKDAQGEEILRAIRAAVAGGSVLSPPVARTVVDRARRMHAGGTAARRAGFSDRERQVLRLLADGKDNAEIAAELFISLPTVKRTVSVLLRKLGATNRLQAAIKAVRSGLI